MASVETAELFCLENFHGHGVPWSIGMRESESARTTILTSWDFAVIQIVKNPSAIQRQIPGIEIPWKEEITRASILTCKFHGSSLSEWGHKCQCPEPEWLNTFSFIVDLQCCIGSDVQQSGWSHTIHVFILFSDTFPFNCMLDMSRVPYYYSRSYR